MDLSSKSHEGSVILVSHGAGLVLAFGRLGRKRNDDGLNQYRSWIGQPVLSELTVWVPRFVDDYPLVWRDIAVARGQTSSAHIVLAPFPCGQSRAWG